MLIRTKFSGIVLDEQIRVFSLGERLKDWLTSEVGGEWIVETWENCGWHVSCRYGTLSVSIYDDGSYLLMNNGDGEFEGAGDPQITNPVVFDRAELKEAIIQSLKEQALIVKKYYIALLQNKSILENQKLLTPVQLLLKDK